MGLTPVNPCTQKIQETQAHAWGESVEALTAKYRKENIAYILFTIFEKNADGQWERKHILHRLEDHGFNVQRNNSDKKADLYKGWANIVVASAEVFTGMGKAAAGASIVGGILEGTSFALRSVRSTMIDDKRAGKVTLYDNLDHRIKSILNAHRTDIQNAHSETAKHQERLTQTMNRESELMRSILSN